MDSGKGKEQAFLGVSTSQIIKEPKHREGRIREVPCYRLAPWMQFVLNNPPLWGLSVAVPPEAPEQPLSRQEHKYPPVQLEIP